MKHKKEEVKVLNPQEKVNNCIAGIKKVLDEYGCDIVVERIEITNVTTPEKTHFSTNVVIVPRKESKDEKK